MSSSAPRVALSTSAGDFVVELYVNEAPQTCDNFMELAKRGYYDGTKVLIRGYGGGRRGRTEKSGRELKKKVFTSPLDLNLSASSSPFCFLPPPFPWCSHASKLARSSLFSFTHKKTKKCSSTESSATL